MADGREMFVDSLTGNLKLNSTVRPHSSTFPTRWKVDDEWICKNGEKTYCDAPQKFAPNMDEIMEAIGYDENSGKTSGGIVGLHSQSEWERAIFEHEKTNAILQKFGRHLLTGNTQELVDHLNLTDWWMTTASKKLVDIVYHFASTYLIGIVLVSVTIFLVIVICFGFCDWIYSSHHRIQLLRNNKMVTFRTVIMAILTPASFNIVYRNVPDESKEEDVTLKSDKEKEETKTNVNVNVNVNQELAELI